MQPVSVSEYEALARDRLPQGVFDFVSGGAEDEITLRENREAFERVVLRPRVLVDVSHVDTTTDVLGRRLALPVLLAPVGGQRMAHPDGELASARAAASAGTVFVLSTTASATIEEVAEASADAPWLQLYVFTRPFARSLVERAQDAGYAAVCVTVDSPVLGRRERDLRNQMPFPPEAFPRNLIGAEDLLPGLHNPAVTWDDIDWLRSITDLPLVLKGIVTAEDARLAVEHGVAGIVVSNHGGRQLDSAIAGLDALPEVVEAAGDRVEVLLDGGVRRGTDVLKAIALGAKAVLVGRPMIWALAVDGEAGVRSVLDMLERELAHAMALAGCPSLAAVDRALVRVR